jgi:hypothetical protein
MCRNALVRGLDLESLRNSHEISKWMSDLSATLPRATDGHAKLAAWQLSNSFKPALVKALVMVQASNKCLSPVVAALELNLLLGQCH